MAKNEKSTQKTSKIASQALKNPGSITRTEIRSLAGSVLTQAPDRSKSAGKKQK